MSFIQDYSIGYCYNMALELKEDLSDIFLNGGISPSGAAIAGNTR
jgi:hypothetical protein